MEPCSSGNGVGTRPSKVFSPTISARRGPERTLEYLGRRCCCLFKPHDGRTVRRPDSAGYRSFAPRTRPRCVNTVWPSTRKELATRQA